MLKNLIIKNHQRPAKKLPKYDLQEKMFCRVFFQALHISNFVFVRAFRSPFKPSQNFIFNLNFKACLKKDYECPYFAAELIKHCQKVIHPNPII